MRAELEAEELAEDEADAEEDEMEEDGLEQKIDELSMLIRESMSAEAGVGVEDLGGMDEEGAEEGFSFGDFDDAAEEDVDDGDAEDDSGELEITEDSDPIELIRELYARLKDVESNKSAAPVMKADSNPEYELCSLLYAIGFKSPARQLQTNQRLSSVATISLIEDIKYQAAKGFINEDDATKALKELDKYLKNARDVEAFDEVELEESDGEKMADGKKLSLKSRGYQLMKLLKNRFQKKGSLEKMLAPLEAETEELLIAMGHRDEVMNYDGLDDLDLEELLDDIMVALGGKHPMQDEIEEAGFWDDEDIQAAYDDVTEAMLDARQGQDYVEGAARKSKMKKTRVQKEFKSTYRQSISVECPVCGAAVGQKCIENGREVDLAAHQARVELAARKPVGMSKREWRQDEVDAVRYKGLSRDSLNLIEGLGFGFNPTAYGMISFVEPVESVFVALEAEESFDADVAVIELREHLKGFENDPRRNRKSRFAKAESLYLSDETMMLLSDIGWADEVRNPRDMLESADDILASLISLMQEQYEELGLSNDEIEEFEERYSSIEVVDAKEEFQEAWEEYRISGVRQREEDYVYGKSRSRVTRSGRTNAEQESKPWVGGKSGGRKTTTGTAKSPTTNAEQEGQVWIGKRRMLKDRLRDDLEMSSELESFLMTWLPASQVRPDEWEKYAADIIEDLRLLSNEEYEAFDDSQLTPLDGRFSAEDFENLRQEFLEAYDDYRYIQFGSVR